MKRGTWPPPNIKDMHKNVRSSIIDDSQKSYKIQMPINSRMDKLLHVRNLIYYTIKDELLLHPKMWVNPIGKNMSEKPVIKEYLLYDLLIYKI